MNTSDIISKVGERKFSIYTLRKSGKTFRELGKMFEISHGRASKIYHECKNIIDKGKTWNFGLPSRAWILTVYGGFNSREEILEGVKSGKIRPGFIRNYGNQLHKIVRAWLDLKPGEYETPKTCKFCGCEIPVKTGPL